jgi:hypothetical protein
MGKGDDTKVQGSPPPNRPKRASSLPHLLTNPRATPVKTVEKRENWQKAMKLNGFVLEEILGHEVCAEATGGYKILTKWPSNPPTKAGVTEWNSVKTIYSYFPKDLQEYVLRASVPGLVPQVLLPKGSGRPPTPPIEAVEVEAEASGSDWLDRNIFDVPSVAMDPGSNMFGPHHPPLHRTATNRERTVFVLLLSRNASQGWGL